MEGQAMAEEISSSPSTRDVMTPWIVIADEENEEVNAWEPLDHHQPRFIDQVPDIEVEIPIAHLEISDSQYSVYDVDTTVDKVLRRTRRSGDEAFRVRLRSGHHDEVTRSDLEHLPKGRSALFHFEEAEENHRSVSDGDALGLRRSSRAATHKRARLSDLTSSDSEDSMSSESRKRIKLIVKRPNATSRGHHGESDSEDIFSQPSQGLKRTRSLNLRSSTSHQLIDTDDEDDLSAESSGGNFIDSLYTTTRKTRRKPGRPPRRRKSHLEVARRSERTVNRESMRELLEDDIPMQEADDVVRPKVTGAKERFHQRPATDKFRHRHLQDCMACGKMSESSESGPLVFCRGCTDAYHSGCLGARATREHLVTKVGPDEFVLQCRRCVDAAIRKDPIAPRLSKCQICCEAGAATAPLRARKTPKEEQKEREENRGQDPVTIVPSDLLFNEKNLLFRCATCHRGWHMHHLPAREESLFEPNDQEGLAEKRWSEYCVDFACQECLDMPSGIGGIIAWRPTDPETYIVGTGPEDVPDDNKEFLIKWANKSHFASLWMPGAWAWSMVSKTMLMAYLKRGSGKIPPILRAEDAIPEEYLRVDIVFSVQYNNIVNEHIEEVDIARIREVDKALVKFKGLGYEDAVWEKPPNPTQEPERWEDFKLAYNDWVRGSYVHLPPSSTLNQNLKRVRTLPFEDKVMLKEQPASLKGGQLMSYQLDGLNWLYYQWHRGQNAILADEMGLGKTIQVIGFLLTLQEKHRCWPALVVVPNSTCANWKRELRLWAPSLRVVTYFGGAAAMSLTEKYELFRENSRDPSCHIVVTSYDAAQGSALKALRRVSWQALVVDEGQRLKNDEGLLYQSLSKLKTPFKLLLTGTPLQNRQRELFNLLQFLDSSKDAKLLEAQYEELNRENIAELHNILRPFFLRRTKAQVLDFLPRMAQIIVPVSMSALQKELYKSILAKNAEVLRSIFGGERRAAARGGLRNILMQLRKCLCHPFVYNLGIEERSVEAAVTHRRLVEASSKLQILELMLPKLHERGHRVLIFSQFLDMLTIMEDFLEDLGLEHLRLDGSMGSLQKQKCIDSFNAEDSKVFAFLLSTRAGGVGINLATADTVIILDPDFNPHQDIQAISRAHRIGQKKKVLVFQLMTRASAEEKIMQIGKKKMALDHALIDSMEGEEEDVEEVEAVLRFGAEALFKDDGSSDTRYDSASVDNLLDRSQMENTKTDKENSVESQFSFARVWQNDSAALVEGLGASDDKSLNAGVWDQILAERSRRAQEEAALKAERLGRGKRQRKDVDYNNQIGSTALADSSPVARRNSDIDTDFQSQNDSEDDDEVINAQEVSAESRALDGPPKSLPRIEAPSQSVRAIKQASPLHVKSSFKRVAVPPQPSLPPPTVEVSGRMCPACGKKHPTGSCPLKLAGYEKCGLCGLAHFGRQRTCPHLSSETQVRLILQALDQSPESKELIQIARKNLKELKANLISAKKNKGGRGALAGDEEPPKQVPQISQAVGLAATSKNVTQPQSMFGPTIPTATPQYLPAPSQQQQHPAPQTQSNLKQVQQPKPQTHPKSKAKGKQSPKQQQQPYPQQHQGQHQPPGHPVPAPIHPDHQSYASPPAAQWPLHDAMMPQQQQSQAPFNAYGQTYGAQPPYHQAGWQGGSTSQQKTPQNQQPRYSDLPEAEIHRINAQLQQHYSHGFAGAPQPTGRATSGRTEEWVTQQGQHQPMQNG